jgi:two-component system, cell cycle response regulator CpdR
MIRVVLADDLALVRGGMRVILEAEPDIRVVGEAADGAEAVEQSIQLGPDVVVMDIRMPVMDGIALALAASRDYPGLTILLMTGYADQRERAHGLNALIHDVITKPFSLGDIRGAVNDALKTRVLN